MDRRRSLLKIAALRSEREQQVGVNCTKGYLQSQSAGLLFEGPRTLECLFRYIPSDKMQVIAGFGISMIEIYALTTNQLRVYCGGGNATVDIVPGDSYLVDVAYDGTTAICYLNGAEAARFPVTGYKVTDLFRTGSNTYIPQGSLVFCRHYNYAISAEEAAAHYNDGDPAGYILPQNLKNIKDMAFTSKTFEFDMDSPYYQRVLESGELESGGKYRVDYVVEEWDIAPAVIGSCGISCGVLSTVGTQYWPNLSAAKLGENQYVVLDTKETGTPYMFVYASNPSDTYTSRRLKVTVHSVKMLGCVAEYLPQNLVGSPHGDPVEIIGENSHTWTGVDDPVYSYAVRCSRYFKISEIYKVRVIISNWEAGGPPYFKIATNNTVIMSGFTGNGIYEFYITAEGTPYDYMFLYAGHGDTDRRMMITVDSIEPVTGVAISWLDSAKQLPLNDEYLPPLLEAIVEGDATPIRIMGNNSYTWAGTESAYAAEVELSRLLVVDQIYRVSITLSGYEAGTPDFKISSEGTTKIPKADGVYTFDVRTKGMPYRKILLYGGMKDSDRRLTLTVNSIEPVVERGYDLAANGAPQIIIK